MNQTLANKISPYVEQAFKSYHDLDELSGNPLSRQFTRDVYYKPGEDASNSLGIALRRLLDQIIDDISRIPQVSTHPKSEWRIEQYLHLFYREEIPHNELARQMGYSEYHLSNLRMELIYEAAEMIVERVG